jgi:hypothetical protein
MREIGTCLDEVANLLWDNVSNSVSHLEKTTGISIVAYCKQQNFNVQ